MVRHKHKVQKAIVDDHDYSQMFEPIRKPRSPKRQSLKAQFYRVRRLIETQRYNEARYELLGIDHPKAQEWLIKLNKLDPDYSETTIILLKPLLLLLILVCLGMAVLVAIGQIDASIGMGLGFALILFFLLFLSVWSHLK